MALPGRLFFKITNTDADFNGRLLENIAPPSEISILAETEKA
jgi:hypothetical protein